MTNIITVFFNYLSSPVNAMVGTTDEIPADKKK